MTSKLTIVKPNDNKASPDSSKSSKKKTPVRKLTSKQLHYCQCRLNGMNQSDSYREAYNTKNMANVTIHAEASRMEANPLVAARIDYIIGQKDKAFIRSAVSLKDKVLSKLEHFMDTATPQDSSKIRAAELLGKSIGLFKEVIESNRYDDKSPEELTELLEARLQELTEGYGSDSIN
jgi:hypothetical protein